MADDYLGTRQRTDALHSSANVDAILAGSAARREAKATQIEDVGMTPRADGAADAGVVTGPGAAATMDDLLAGKDVRGLDDFRQEPPDKNGRSRVIGVDEDGNEFWIGTIDPNMQDGPPATGAAGRRERRDRNRQEPTAPILTPHVEIPENIDWMEGTRLANRAGQAAGDREEYLAEMDRYDERGGAVGEFVRDTQAIMNAPFAGLTRGVAEAGAQVAAFLGIADQEEVDEFFDVMEGMAENATAETPTAGLIDATGQIAGQYVAPAVGIYNKLRAAGVGALASAALADTITGAVAVSPNEENLFNMLDDEGVQGAIRELMATDPEGEEWENRARNATEAIIALGVGEAVVRTIVGGVKQARRLAQSSAGQKLEAAIVDEAGEIDPQRVQDLLDQAVEPQAPPRRATSDNVRDVIDAQYASGGFATRGTAPVAKLKGGVDMTQPGERSRVQDIADLMRSPDGYFEEIIVTFDGDVIEGQHRLEAARLLGLKDVPVVQITSVEDIVPIASLRDAMSEAGVRPNQQGMMLSTINDALEEAGSVDALIAEYDAPRGFEQAWHRVTQMLSDAVQSGALAKGVVAATGAAGAVALSPEEAEAGIGGRIDDLLRGGRAAEKQATPEVMDEIVNGIRESGTIPPSEAAERLADFNYNQWEDPDDIDALFQSLVDVTDDMATAQGAKLSDEAQASMARTIEEIKANKARLDATYQAGEISSVDYAAMSARMNSQLRDTQARLAESNRKSKLGQARQTVEDSEWLGARLGLTPDQLINHEVGRAYTAPEIKAIKVMLDGMMRRLRELHEVAATAPTPENVVNLRRHAMVTAGVMLRFRGARREAGRALQALRGSATTPVAREAEVTVLHQIGERNQTNDAYIKAIGEILAMGDEAALGQFIRESRDATTPDMLFEAWVNAILGNPATHAVNVMSNAMLGMMMVGDRYAAGAIGSARQAMGGDAGATISEANAYALATIPAMLEALKVSTRTLITGQATDVMGKIAPEFDRAITADNINAAMERRGLPPNLLKQGGIAARTVDFFGEYYYRMPGRLLTAEDDFFKVIAYRQELHAQAIREAMQNPQWTEAQAQARYKEIIEDPQVNAPHIHLRAIDNSRLATLTMPQGPIGQGMQQLRNRIPGGRWVVPFLGVINNIIRTTYEHTPLKLPASLKMLRDPNVPQAEKDELLGRVAAGSAVLAGFAALSMDGDGPMSGVVTGRMTGNAQMRDTLERQGRQEYSIYIPTDHAGYQAFVDFIETGAAAMGGDEFAASVRDMVSMGENGIYVSYQRTAPIGALMAMGAEMGAAMNYAETDKDMADIAVGAVAAIIPFMYEQTALTGVSDALEVLNPQYAANDDDAGRKMLRFFANLGASLPGAVAGPLAPGTPLMGQIARNIDPIRRDARPQGGQPAIPHFWDSMIGRIYSKTPGLSSTLPAFRNVWGEEQNYGAFGPDAFSPLWSRESQINFGRLAKIEGLPDRAKSPNGDFTGMRVGEEMTRSAYRQWLNVVGIDGEIQRLDMPFNRPSRTMKGIKLTTEQYQEYVFLAGQGVKLRGDGGGLAVENSAGRVVPYTGNSMPQSVRQLIPFLGLDASKTYTQKEFLDLLIRTPFYQDRIDGIDTDGLEGADTKREIIKAVHRWYNEQAAAAMSIRFPEIGRQLRQQRVDDLMKGMMQ